MVIKRRKRKRQQRNDRKAHERIVKCDQSDEKARVEEREKDSRAIAKGAASSATRPRNAEHPCQSER